MKFQTFSAEKFASQSAQMADYQKRNTEAEESQFAMLKKLELSRDAYPALLQRCRERLGVGLNGLPELGEGLFDGCLLRWGERCSGHQSSSPFSRLAARMACSTACRLSGHSSRMASCTCVTCRS